MFRSCGAETSEAEGIVNFLAGTEGSRAAVDPLPERGRAGWRVSLRSLAEDVDVAAIAAVFGGGGHPRAAGCQCWRETRRTRRRSCAASPSWPPLAVVVDAQPRTRTEQVVRTAPMRHLD